MKDFFKNLPASTLASIILLTSITGFTSLIIGLIVLHYEKENEFVIFYTKQSLIYGSIFCIINIINFYFLFSFIITLILLILILYTAYKAYKGEIFQFNFIEKIKDYIKL